MKSPSPREHVLLILALLVGVGVGWYVLRALPAKKRAAALEEDTAEREGELRGARIPREPSVRPAQLEAVIATLREARTAADAAVASAEARWSDDEGGATRVALADLALATGVAVETFRPLAEKLGHGRDAASGPRDWLTAIDDPAAVAAIRRVRRPVSAKPARARRNADAPAGPTASAIADDVTTALVGGRPYARPVHELQVRAPFGALRAFVDGLGRLPGRVVILRFDIDAGIDRDGAGGGILTARLVVAL